MGASGFQNPNSESHTAVVTQMDKLKPPSASYAVVITEDIQASLHSSSSYTDVFISELFFFFCCHRETL